METIDRCRLHTTKAISRKTLCKSADFYYSHGMHIQVVAPQPAMMQAISALYAKTWLATYPNEAYGITRDDIKERTDAMTDPEKVAERLVNIMNVLKDPMQFYRVAVDGNEVVGVCAGKVKDECVHLSSLYVLPERQGMGIGTQLLDAFLAWAKTHKKPIQLHVVTYNTGAIQFYQTHGFVDTGRRFTEDRFIMKSGNGLPEMEMRYQVPESTTVSVS